MSDFKPAGFHSVTPYLVVEGADRLLQFLKDAFDAEELFTHRRDDGAIMHCEMKIGDSVVEMGQANPKWAAMPTSLHLYVPDTDAVYAKAMAAGAKSLEEPKDADYGDRTAGVQDPAGNHWFIATFQRR
jgi:uncharacterized glyoxalase superfamily protein PhnB